MADPAALARDGDLDALLELLADNDRAAYKWLTAAADFGHGDADDYIGDLLETSSLRYDDTRYETAAAHWELACAYLEGTEGLEVDLARAAAQLELAFEHHTLDAINAGAGTTYRAEPILARLPDAARDVLLAGIAGDDIGRATKLLGELRRLVELRAPEVIIEGNRRALRSIMLRICPEPDEQTIARMGSDPLDDELHLTEATVALHTDKLALLRAELAKRQREREPPAR